MECIGGTFSAKVLECMPPKSTCVIYGSFREVGLEGFDPLLMIGRSYRVEGFILGLFIKSKGLCGVLPLKNKAIALMNDSTLHSKIQRKLKFSEFREGINDYYKSMTNGKFILCPNDLDEALQEAELCRLEDSPIFEEFEIKHLNSD